MAGIFKTNGVWTCGFDFFGTGSSQIQAGGVFDLVSAPANLSCDPTYARYSGKGIRTSGVLGVGRTLGVNLQSMIVGFAFWTAGLPAGSNTIGILAFEDLTAGALQVGLGYNSQGQFQFYQSGVLVNFTQPSVPIGLPSAANLLTVNTYMYLEVMVTIASGGAGQLILNVNGTQAINFTGNTKQTANAWVSQVVIGENGTPTTPDHHFDDLYMLDLTAPAPLNTFCGPVRVQTDTPNADSANAGLNQWSFTTPQGTDFGNLANIPPNTAQYDFDGNVGDRMSFRFPSLTSLVYALNMWYSAEEDAAGTRSLVPIFRNNGNDQVGTSPGNLNSSYTYYNQAANLDPNTGNPWTSGPQGAVNACELGLKVAS
jgi:hypothetical protein